MIYYDVCLTNENFTLIKELKRTCTTSEAAETWIKIHKVELADNERFLAIKREFVDDVENIPQECTIISQIYTTNESEDDIPDTDYSVSIEEVETVVQSIKTPDNIRLKADELLIYQDDANIEKSYTVCFPLDINLLLQEKINKKQLEQIALRILKAYQKKITKKKPIFRKENFNINFLGEKLC